ncbi:hypothetical protein CONCODRAFT_12505 [Conidiobolus coronatus NRRL 28638]|uniref:RNI-like protein n=1 Tax=Conidiobolus coronatus (strain ATCC 28846 / CBS 209.66 / NRRL 28638) TaxID=796925 RepID=A0A137NSW6_CONC2|nr:hypothetical protein CONCODRAFT_12505 [Conidiobolus coronatus NRRL 28638]|eukprot:KXN65800.1 hypothetical protein CONCODRAFT_12505 [Conidiobolus coronatus NRRL 28638]
MNAVKIEENHSQVCNSDITQINPVLPKIFEYSTFQDLKAFNTVCKKWNQLTNPIIHKSIQLIPRYIRSLSSGFAEIYTRYFGIDIEVGECIVNNAKHASFVKSFNYYEKLKPHTAIEFFETFKYLTKLEINSIKISQGQFLCIIKPLNMLRELSLHYINIEEIKSQRLCKESIQLRQTLIKLSIENVILVGNPMLFTQTINSHSNLKEVVFNYCSIKNLLIPFNSHYPSLKYLEYKNNYSKNHHTLLTSISQYLTGLEELNLYDYSAYLLGDDCASNSLYTLIKVKKLVLNCSELRPCLLSLIFKGCPELDECILNIYGTAISKKIFSFNIGIHSKIKKLKINSKTLSISSLEAILTNCPYLTELDILLPKRWKSHFKVIKQRCKCLERLKLQPFFDCYIDEYNSLEFLAGNPSFKNTLTSLILDKFNYELVNPKHIEHYPNLNCIKFSNQSILTSNKYEDKVSNLLTLQECDAKPGFGIIPCTGYKIRRSLKLLRYNDIRKKRYNGLTAAERREAELVKEIALSTRIKPAKTIEFFATFKFLTKLDINDVPMTQGQFIRILKSLTQLQELNINNFEVTERNKNLIKKGDIYLPSTLTKLTFINSHNNLIEFKFNAGNFFDILEPFQKNYPSLKKFEYNNSILKNDEGLLNLIKHNPQLRSLHLDLECLNEKFGYYISQYLVNLEELHLRKFRHFNQENPPLILKLRRPTIIKKLKLNCEDLSESSLNSILTNCPQLRDLEVFLPYEWRSWGKLISTKCVNLEKLTINPSIAIHGEDRVTFIQEFYKSEFLTNRSIITDTLMHLTFYGFDFADSKAEYFNMFKNLRFIKFAQLIENDYKIDAWRNYSMKKCHNKCKIDIELSKVK